MTLALLDSVVLQRDMPEHGLRKGDLGAVVEVYGPEDVEVEVVTAGGKTQALLTLHPSDLRHVTSTDIVAVRPTKLDQTG